jgi:hypothetical protein
MDRNQTVAERVEHLKQLAKNWDGYGAEPIREAAIDEAEAFVEAHSPQTLPWFIPMTDGRVQIEWHRGEASLEMEFAGTGDIHYLWCSDTGNFEESRIPLSDVTTIRRLLGLILGNDGEVGT